MNATLCDSRISDYNIIRAIVAHSGLIKQYIHIDDLRFGRIWREQFWNMLIISAANTVILLHIISPYSSHGLDDFFLCHVEVFADVSVAELIISAINIIAWADY